MAWNLRKLFLPALLAAVMLPAFSAVAAQAAPHPPRPRMEKTFHMHFGRWWDNPRMAQKLGLSTEQQHKMDAIFRRYRPSLEQLHANLHHQESVLGPLIGADHPDEDRILAQIDVVAQARANLEKEFARMLLGIRRQLTQEQWEKLKAMHAKHMAQMKQHDWHHGPHGPMPPPPPHP